MKILVIGGGGREHAILWKLRQSPKVSELYAAPGNAGTAMIATNLNIQSSDMKGLADAAGNKGVDLTVVGPEAPLAEGMVNYFQSRGLKIFGPTKEATAIESSKAFSRALMKKYNIACARGESFHSLQEAIDYVKKQEMPIVIKADGLAAGKGVAVASTVDEALSAVHDIMEKKIFGAAGETVVVEEFLSGREVSLLAFTDGKTVIPMLPACDYKKALDGDKGLNTGGMGSYSPATFFGKNEVDRAKREILEPAIKAMAAEGRPFKGILYAGLIHTSQGTKVLEFNARFGDPETQVILPLLKTDLVDIMLSTLTGTLNETKIDWTDGACVTAVMASKGYPGKYQTGFPITGLDKVDEDILVFHSGTKYNGKSGEVLTSGGRVLAVTAKGRTVAEARANAYFNISCIKFDNCFYRKDIAAGI